MPLVDVGVLGGRLDVDGEAQAVVVGRRRPAAATGVSCPNRVEMANCRDEALLVGGDLLARVSAGDT